MRGSHCCRIVLFYLSHSLIQPKSPINSWFKKTETLQNIQELAENTYCKGTSKRKPFPKAQQCQGTQQTLLQKPDEDLYIVNLIAEGAC